MPNRLPKKIANLIFCGRYSAYRRIASGSWATVYDGVDLTTSSPVAIKVRRERNSRFSQDTSAFFHEQAILDRLPKNRDYFPKVLASGTEHGTSFIVFDRIDGVTLRNVLTFCPSVSHELIVAWVVELTRIVQVLHRYQVQHRDIKPENIIVRLTDLFPVLVDYGSALCLDDFVAKKGFQIEGSLPYVAPEALNGTAPFFNGQADIFSIGAILYEMLVGQPLFADRPLHEIRLPTIMGTQMWEKMQPAVAGIFRQPPQPIRQLRDIDQELAGICEQALAYDMSQRFQSAQDLSEALEKYLERYLLKRRIRMDLRDAREKLRRALPTKFVVQTPPRDDSPRLLVSRFKHRAPSPITCSIESLAFSPTGNILMTVAGTCEQRSRNGILAGIDPVASIRLWNVAERRPITHVTPTKERVRLHARFLSDGSIMAISPAGAWLISGDGYRVIRTVPFDFKAEAVKCIAIAPDERRMAIGLAERIHIVDVEAGTTLNCIEYRRLHPVCLEFVPCSDALVCGRWSIEKQMQSEVGEYDPDLDGIDPEIIMWDSAGKIVSEVEMPGAHANHIAFFPDGRRMTVAGMDGFLGVCTVERRLHLTELTFDGHDCRVNGVAISPNAEIIASCGGSGRGKRDRLRDATVRVWDQATGAERLRFYGRNDPFTAVAFDPKGRTLAAADSSGTIWVWNINEHQNRIAQ
jgi:serine/threonine protein kinase